jgi:cytochrome c556
MGRTFTLMAVFLFLTSGLFVASSLTADDEKTPPKDEIMKKVCGRKGLRVKTVEAAKAGKWEDAQKLVAEMKPLSEALGKNQPNKGEQASWEKLTKAFVENTLALEEGVKDKDLKAVEKAVEDFQPKSCKTCHDAHK